MIACWQQQHQMGQSHVHLRVPLVNRVCTHSLCVCVCACGCLGTLRVECVYVCLFLLLLRAGRSSVCPVCRLFIGVCWSVVCCVLGCVYLSSVARRASAVSLFTLSSFSA